MSPFDRGAPSLRVVTPKAPLVARDTSPASPDVHAAEWVGRVRIDEERAALASAPRFHAQVRTGLLERTRSLGADHVAGPHLWRPEVARRFVAHVDALAEGGASADEITRIAAEHGLEDPGAAWAATLLLGCLDIADADACFEAWASAITPDGPFAYATVIAIGRALRDAPSPTFAGLARRFLSAKSEVLRAIAIESLSPFDLSDADLAACAGLDARVVWTALDRLLARGPRDTSKLLRARPSWADLGTSELAFESARARVVSGDGEPLRALRAGDEEALAALGPLALDLLALGCEPADAELAHSVARGAETTPRLLSALGRIGLPALFPRLFSALQDEDFKEDASAALSTALGAPSDEPSVAAWQRLAGAATEVFPAARLRAGAAFGASAIRRDLARPEHSAQDIETRANELFVMAGRVIDLPWLAFGVSLEAAIASLSSHTR